MNTKFVLLAKRTFSHILEDMNSKAFRLLRSIRETPEFQLPTSPLKSSLKSVSELYMHLCLQFSGYMILLQYMCFQMCISLKNIHLGLCKNLRLKYRKLIAELLSNQQLQFGWESQEVTKNWILWYQSSCSQISVFHQILKLKEQNF